MGPVSRANNLTGLHFRPLQRFAVVRATVFYCVKIWAAAYDKEGHPVDIHGYRGGFVY
jgi:hypothetical protein